MSSGHTARRRVLMVCFLAYQLVSIPSVLAKRNYTPQQVQASQLFSEGTQLLQQKKPFKARKPLEHAAALWPDHAPIHYNLGYCYHDCGLFEPAIGEFQKALRLDGSLHACVTNIANCYQQLGRTSEAIRYLQESLKRKPKDAESVKGLINALKHAESEQILSDPQAPDYFPSICKRGKFQRWPQQKVPLKVFIADGTDEHGRKVQGFRPEYLSELQKALDDWCRASQGRLAYVVVSDHASADIVCTWTDDLAFPRETNNKAEQGLAEIKFRDTGAATREIGFVHLTVLVLDRQSRQPLSDDEMKTVCLHELGHALGLNGHSPNNRDVMFFSMSPSVWPSLTKRDKATLLKLYADYPQSAQLRSDEPLAGQPNLHYSEAGSTSLRHLPPQPPEAGPAQWSR